MAARKVAVIAANTMSLAKSHIWVRQLRCSVTNAKRSFNRSTNAIFGKVGRIASEEVTVQLLKSKCLPIFLYGLECYSLLKTDLHSVDFAVMRLLMKLCRTANDIIYECRSFCNFLLLPTETLETKSNKFCKKFKCNKSMLSTLISALAKRFPLWSHCHTVTPFS